MFKYQFHLRLAEVRRKAGLTQQEAGEFVGISRGRWSQLETGYRTPSRDELQSLKCHFFLGEVYVPHSGTYRELRDAGAKLVSQSSLFLAWQDRDSFIRYWKAIKKYPVLIEGLMEVVSAREDFESIQYLFHRISFDSYVEVLYFLLLVACGATPISAPPLLLGQPPSPILEPRTRCEVGHFPHPGLDLQGTTYFFQVSFRLSIPIRVDILAHNGGWKTIEILREGYDFKADAGRQELGLPIQIVSEAEVIERISRLLKERANVERAA
ncbi:MAG: helix-turn-helix transcriptional regulator [Candidatus Eremiobacteraeota bacterium]|nr:helix-turn-helix transcriptional regulator [Candidatus Eremiobacteraeota bacterium]